MRLIATLLLPLLGSALAADDHEPLYLMAGVNHPAHNASDGLNSFGSYVGFGYVSGDPGLFQSGQAGVDFEWRHTAGANTHLDSVDICYSERLFGIADGLYLGYGIGSSYNILRRDGPDPESAKGWRISGKLMVGYDLGGGLIMEAAYIVSGEVGNVSTNGLTIAAGFWF